MAPPLPGRMSHRRMSRNGLARRGLARMVHVAPYTEIVVLASTIVNGHVVAIFLKNRASVAPHVAQCDEIVKRHVPSRAMRSMRSISQLRYSFIAPRVSPPRS